MEAWRQWPLGGRRKRAYQKQTKITLTPTGLLMEGGYAHWRGPRKGFWALWRFIASWDDCWRLWITSGWPTIRRL